MGSINAKHLGLIGISLVTVYLFWNAQGPEAPPITVKVSDPAYGEFYTAKPTAASPRDRIPRNGSGRRIDRLEQRRCQLPALTMSAQEITSILYVQAEVTLIIDPPIPQTKRLTFTNTHMSAEAVLFVIAEQIGGTPSNSGSTAWINLTQN